jgi:RNA polymerase sigma-70 factor (ECF subfamily)
MDEAAIRAELEALHPESFGWAMSCCRRDRSAAEDVLQRAYLKVLEGKARYGGAGIFKSWFFAVILKTARDESRKRIVRRICFSRFAAEEVTKVQPAPLHRALEQQDLCNVFAAALNVLPARQRQVLQLVFYHDLSLTQAAAVMNVSPGSAKTHYDRGKKALRQRLGGMFNRESSDAFGSGRKRPSLVF